MTPSNARRLVALASLGTLLALPVAAQDNAYSYLGFSLGQSRSKVDHLDITRSLLGTAATATLTGVDRSDTAYKLFLGRQFNPYLGLEAGYFDLGRSRFTSTTVPAGSLNGEVKVQGLNLDLVGTLPVSERFAVLGRAGVQYARTNDFFAGSGAISVPRPNASRRDTNGKVGLGLQYAFSPGFMLRGEVERYRVNDGVDHHGNVNVASLSLVFPFGRSSAPAPRMAMAPAAPAYVAPPAPAPMVVQAPPPPPPPPPMVMPAPAPPPPAPAPRQRMSLSAESLFTFDKADLRAEGRGALDDFARKLAGSQFDVINVEGHTDRLGTTAYNQALSTRRANAVKSYLIDSGRIDASKVAAAGKGESMPVTKAGDCKGNSPTPKLIACLQPDRRVDIEVVGTR